MSGKHQTETTVRVRVIKMSWQVGHLDGEVIANHYQWRFRWHFREGKLSVEPSLGRALIFEPLGRFLERYDYRLEPGGDYEFTVRAKL